MKLIITAGGGGHFAPALSVMNNLPKDWEVLFVGRKYAFEADKTLSFEYKTAQDLGLPFQSIETARLQRHWSKHTLVSFTKFPTGVAQAYAIVKKYKPDLILSFGGYVSLPVAFAGAMLGIPIVVHEQTLQAGLANKIVSRFAKTICVSWEESKKYFPKEKVVVTGNPIKLEKITSGDFFKDHVSVLNENFPILYITGGSLGSHAINIFIAECIEKLLQRYIVVHQTGDSQEFKDYDALIKKREEFSPVLQKRYILTKFIDPYAVRSVLDKTTLVIARAGMSTVSELLYIGKPALFIPLPIA